MDGGQGERSLGGARGQETHGQGQDVAGTNLGKSNILTTELFCHLSSFLTL